MVRAVIIDCDPGTDDAVALFLALASPELEVRLVTAVGGNASLDHTLRNTRALVGMTKKPVPVVEGSARALLGRFLNEPQIHGYNGINGIQLDDGPPVVPGIAADAIRQVLRTSSQGEVTLLGIGPATNLALALVTEPNLISQVREIVLMTGAWGEGNVTPSAEFNAWNDPEALAILLSMGADVTLVSLDLTAHAVCTPAVVANMRRLGNGECLRVACDIMDSVPPSRRLISLGHCEHDACAVMWLIDPDIFSSKQVYASVDLSSGISRGRTVIDRWDRLKNTPNVRILETLDATRFFSTLATRIADLP